MPEHALCPKSPFQGLALTEDGAPVTLTHDPDCGPSALRCDVEAGFIGYTVSPEIVAWLSSGGTVSATLSKGANPYSFDLEVTYGTGPARPPKPEEA